MVIIMYISFVLGVIAMQNKGIVECGRQQMIVWFMNISDGYTCIMIYVNTTYTSSIDNIKQK